MKKTFWILLAAGVIIAVIAALAYAGGIKGNSDKILTVGASPVPHAELLNLVKDDLASQGITLKVIEFTDYVQPNVAVITGDLDANFFQHIPYLETNVEWSNKLVSVFGVHIEPFGLYSRKYKNLEELPSGALIAIPNDPTNGGRALLLLQANGLIKLREGAGLTATPRDIIANTKKFRFQELEAAQLSRSLPDVDAAAINGNYALDAGFNPLKDSLIIEDADSPYVNIVVARKGKENSAKLQALKKAMLSQKVKDYINNNYHGAVAPVF